MPGPEIKAKHLRIVFSRTFDRFRVRTEESVRMTGQVHEVSKQRKVSKDPLLKKLLRAADGDWEKIQPSLTAVFQDKGFARRLRQLRFSTAGGQEAPYLGELSVKVRIEFEEELQTYRFICEAFEQQRVLPVEPGEFFTTMEAGRGGFYFLRWPAKLSERADFLRARFRLEELVMRRVELIGLGIQGARDLPRPLEYGPAWCVSLEPGPDQRELSIQGKLEMIYGRRAADLKAHAKPGRTMPAELVTFPPRPPALAKKKRGLSGLTATGGGRIVKRSPEREQRLYRQGLPVDCQARTGRFELGPRRLEKFINEEYPVLLAARIPVRLHPDLARLFPGAAKADGSFASSRAVLTLDENEAVSEIDPRTGDTPGWFSGRINITGLAREEWAAVLRAVRAGKSHHRLRDGGWISLASLGVEPLLRLLDALGVKVKAGGVIPRISRGQLAALDEAAALADSVGDESLDDWRRRLNELRARVLRPGRRRARVRVAPGPGFRAKLRSYQRDGLDFFFGLYELGVGGILADDMGLGKTVQSLAFLSRIHAEANHGDEAATDRAAAEGGPSLIVGPLAALSVWRREAERFCPGLAVTVWHGQDRATLPDPSRGLVLTTFAVLARDIKRLEQIRFRALIIDEAQHIKNDRATAARAMRRIKARAAFCLSGTPLENHPADFWSLMDVSFPGLLGTRAAFLKSMRDDPTFAGLKDRIAPFFLRRTKEAVLTELPPRTESAVAVPLTKVGRALYEKVRRAAARELNARGKEDGGVFRMLPHLTRLRRLACHPRLGDGANVDPLQSGKLAYLADQLDELRETASGVLIFSQFTDMLALTAELLKSRGESYYLLRGDTSAKKRQAQVQAFQAGERRFFLISLRAGGTALTLTRADTVFHLDPWWNPAAEDQATGRSYRMGQTRPVFVYKLYGEHTVEQRVLALQTKKRALFEALFTEDGSRAKKNSRLSVEDLRELLKDFSN